MFCSSPNVCQSKNSATAMPTDLGDFPSLFNNPFVTVEKIRQSSSQNCETTGQHCWE
jgi:hypothetical protein